MKQIITIILIFLSNLSVMAKDNTTVKVDNISKIATRVDTVKFVNDTALVAENPKVSHIIYADNSSNSNFIKEYLFPIIMLLLGIGIDRFIVWRGDKKRVRKMGKRWIAELRSILTPLENQMGNLNSFIENFCDKADEYMIPDLTVENSLKGNQFIIFNKEDLYDFLEKANKDELESLYSKVANIASSLEFIRMQLVDKCNAFLRNSDTHVNQYNSSIQDYRLHLSDAVSGHVCQPMQEADITELKKIFEETFGNSAKEFNVYKSKDEFLVPSIDILSKYSHQNDKYLNMVHTLVRCLDCIKGLEMEKIYIKTSYKKIIDMYSNLHAAIQDVLNKVSNKSNT